MEQPTPAELLELVTEITADNSKLSDKLRKVGNDLSNVNKTVQLLTQDLDHETRRRQQAELDAANLRRRVQELEDEMKSLSNPTTECAQLRKQLAQCIKERNNASAEAMSLRHERNAIKNEHAKCGDMCIMAKRLQCALAGALTKLGLPLTDETAEMMAAHGHTVAQQRANVDVSARGHGDASARVERGHVVAEVPTARVEPAQSVHVSTQSTPTPSIKTRPVPPPPVEQPCAFTVNSVNVHVRRIFEQKAEKRGTTFEKLIADATAAGCITHSEYLQYFKNL